MANVNFFFVLKTGSWQGCVMSSLLYSLFTNDCVSHHASVQLIKYADDTSVEGLIENSDESVYRQHVDFLVSWCGRNNLKLSTLKTKGDDHRLLEGKKSPVTQLLIAIVCP